MKRLIEKFVNLEKRTAAVPLIMPFRSSYSIQEPSAEVIAAMTAASLSAKSLQGGGGDVGIEAGLTFDQVQPKDTDYIYPLFRALDAGLIEDYWIDFSDKAVLKASVPLLQGQTIFTNHGRRTGIWGMRELDINDWVGSVNQAVWDEKGDKAGGVSGINSELKIDWTVDPKLARGLLMKPPAVNAVSVTPVFSWVPSHQDLMDQCRFLDLLGETVDDQIVRLVVTKIHEYREESLVLRGANAGSNGQIGDDETNEEMSALRARLSEVLGNESRRSFSVSKISAAADPANKEKKKVKLTAEQKKALGLEAQTGDEFEDAIVLGAVDSLSARIVSAEARATAVQPIIDAQRAEVVRLATISEGVIGADKQVALPPVIAEMITKADASQLPGLETLYKERVDAKFAPKCAKCGSTEVSRRSSVEDGAQSQSAPARRVPRSGL